MKEPKFVEGEKVQVIHPLIRASGYVNLVYLEKKGIWPFRKHRWVYGVELVDNYSDILVLEEHLQSPLYVIEGNNAENKDK